MKTHSTFQTLSIVFGLILAAGTLPVPQRSIGAAAEAAAACILRVNASASGGDGSTWPKAYNNLQNAINAAFAAAPCQVWVEQGTYKPTGSRLASFSLQNGVEVYGGFIGNENALSQRNWQANPTILSGDIYTPNDASDNIYNLVWIPSSINSTARLDGFTIMAANANCTHDNYCQEGGGVNITGGSPTLANLNIHDNNALLYGGGIFIDGGSPYIYNVIVQNNTAANGAGAYLSNNSNASIIGGDFAYNTAATDGGGLFNDSTSTALELITVTFLNNHAGHAGGGAYIYGQATLSNEDFEYNSADFGAGLLVDKGTGSLLLSNSTFYNNTATSKGGGVYIYSTSPELTNVLFIQNKAVNYGGGAIGGYKSSPILTNLSLSQNTSTTGGGIYNSNNSHPVVRNSILWGDTGGEVYNDPGYTASTITITYSLAQGCNPGGVWNSGSCGANGGSNLVDGDPYFMDPTAYDFHLQARSPAINKGNNAFVSGVTTDLADKARIYGGVVDLGPYECTYYRVFAPIIMK